MTAARQVMTGTILAHKEILPGHFRMTVSCAPLMEVIPSPGQFVMVRRRAEDTPFLPRPFSVYDMDATKGRERVGLLYRVAGKGTEIFSRMKRGRCFPLSVPWAGGFRQSRKSRHSSLWAGEWGWFRFTIWRGP